MKKFFIVDAVNFLFRSYYAIGPMTNDRGESTNALFGFIRTIQKLLKDFSPDYLAVVFDGPENKKSRQMVYSEYKMHRKGAPEDLFLQFEYAFKFCELSGFTTLSVTGVEADDTMATIAKWAKDKDLEIYLCTSDKDLFQLVSSNIFILQPHKENLIIDEKKVEELLGVRPNQVVDLLALMGDTSDNIPGIKGVGPKTAASLLKDFDTLDNILANISNLKTEKQRTLFSEQKESAILSKKLALLNFDVEIPKDLKSYQINPLQEEELIRFYQEMKFLKFLEGLKKEEKRGPSKENFEVSTNYRIIDTEKDLEDLSHFLKDSKEISVDTETDANHPMLAKLIGIGFSTKPGEAFYIPFNGNLESKFILEKLKPVLEDPKISFIGHNIKYDFHILKNYNIEIKNISFDTLIASYLLNPQHRRHNLDHLSLEYFNKKKVSYDELLKKRNSLLEVPIEEVATYCSEDVDYTIRLKIFFEKELKSKDLFNLFNTMEMPLLPILAKMERVGIFIDISQFDELKEALIKEISHIEKKIYHEVGQTFNLNSPKQLSSILYDTLKLPPPRRKTTEYSTAADVLEKLSEISPIVATILEYRGLQKLLSTYIEALPKEINPTTGRIHATFSQSIAATGRLSCQDPNLQNIPLHSEGGEKIRKAFMPQKKGWSYLSSDYSQIELRLLAHLSQDPELIYAFQKEKDIHAHTASLVFDIPVSEVTKEMRHQAKAVNFGILYGQGVFGLSQSLKITSKKASELIDIYFSSFKKIKPYLEESVEKAKKTGYAITLLGRKRPILEILNKNPQVRAAAERLAINTPLQGTAADLIKLAMIEIDREIQKQNIKGFMILQIHDELLFEIPDEEISLFKKIVQDKMQNVIKIDVPLVVNIKIGKNWGEC